MNFSDNEFTKLLKACDCLNNEKKEKLLKHLIGTYTNASVLFEICDRLSNEERGKLLKHLIGRDTSLSVAVGSSSFNANANTVYQINISDKEQVSDVLRAIAKIIEN
ncbi:MAG: hypothetical protein AAF378_00640 [Cyanobacteria bacterium P01_A01_bin.84]